MGVAVADAYISVSSTFFKTFVAIVLPGAASVPVMFRLVEHHFDLQKHSSIVDYSRNRIYSAISSGFQVADLWKLTP